MVFVFWGVKSYLIGFMLNSVRCLFRNLLYFELTNEVCSSTMELVSIIVIMKNSPKSVTFIAVIFVSLIVSFVVYFAVPYILPHCLVYATAEKSDAMTMAGSYIAYSTLLFTIVGVALVVFSFYVGTIVLSTRVNLQNTIVDEIRKKIKNEDDDVFIKAVVLAIASNPEIINQLKRELYPEKRSPILDKSESISLLP